MRNRFRAAAAAAATAALLAGPLTATANAALPDAASANDYTHELLASGTSFTLDFATDDGQNLHLDNGFIAGSLTLQYDADSKALALRSEGQTLIVSDSGSIFLSEDDGNTWKAQGSPLGSDGQALFLALPLFPDDPTGFDAVRQGDDLVVSTDIATSTCTTVLVDGGALCRTTVADGGAATVTYRVGSDPITVPSIPRFTPKSFNPKIKKFTKQQLERVINKRLKAAKLKARTDQYGSYTQDGTFIITYAMATDAKHTYRVKAVSVSGSYAGFTGVEGYLQTQGRMVTFSKGVATWSSSAGFTAAKVSKGVIITVEASSLKTAKKILKKIK